MHEHKWIKISDKKAKCEGCGAEQYISKLGENVQATLKTFTPSFIPIDEKRFLEIMRGNKGIANTQIIRKGIGGKSSGKQNNAIRKVAEELKRMDLITISFTQKKYRPTRVYKLK